MDVKIESSWKEHLKGEFEKPYFQQLAEFVKSEYRAAKVYPPAPQIFRAFELCPFNEVKVVIIGQDPYHGDRQANGLSFSVAEGLRIPPSLQNIYKEIASDLGKPYEELMKSGDLDRWAKQGVLLLNATLTVRASSAGSHQNKGWEEFTDAVISTLTRELKGLVYMLWGAYAQKKGALINKEDNLVLESPHPSPFSADRGFFGNKHFSQANAYLESRGEKAIDW